MREASRQTERKEEEERQERSKRQEREEQVKRGQKKQRDTRDKKANCALADTFTGCTCLIADSGRHLVTGDEAAALAADAGCSCGGGS